MQRWSSCSGHLLNSDNCYSNIQPQPLTVCLEERECKVWFHFAVKRMEVRVLWTFKLELCECRSQGQRCAEIQEWLAVLLCLQQIYMFSRSHWSTREFQFIEPGEHAIGKWMLLCLTSTEPVDSSIWLFHLTTLWKVGDSSDLWWSDYQQGLPNFHLR